MPCTGPTDLGTQKVGNNTSRAVLWDTSDGSVGWSTTLATKTLRLILREGAVVSSDQDLKVVERSALRC
jgi:hypothetical protein